MTEPTQINENIALREHDQRRIQYLQCLGKAGLSCLSTGVFLGFVGGIFIASSNYWDSRAEMTFPVILPLLLIGVIYGIRAVSDIRVLRKEQRNNIPRIVIIGVAGLLIPWCIGILFLVYLLLMGILAKIIA